MENWPTFLSYLLGFVVLFSTWYQYHAGSQYVEGTTAWIVWQHGFAMAWVALMPFGVALLAHNLNSPNRKWAIFYFGVCLFGNYWTTLIFMAFISFNFNVSYNELLPIPEEVMRKATPIFFGFTGLFGLILVITSLFYPWVALAGYVAYVASNVSPVGTLNRVKPMLEKMVGAKRD